MLSAANTLKNMLVPGVGCLCLLMLDASVSLGQVTPDTTGLIEVVEDTLGVPALEAVDLPFDVQSAPIPSQDQLVFPTVTIDDSATVAFLMDELLLYDDDEVEALEIIDLTRNGFGPDDVIVFYPSQRTNQLAAEFVSASAQALMAQWAFEAEFRIDGAMIPNVVDLYDPGVEGNGIGPSDVNSAEYALLADVITALRRGYDGERPISLYFEQDQDAFTFQVWGYENNRMAFSPKPPAQPDTLTAFDLLYVQQTTQDTLYMPGLDGGGGGYDLLYLERAVQDTLYMPGLDGGGGGYDLLYLERAVQDTLYMPGLDGGGGGYDLLYLERAVQDTLYMPGLDGGGGGYDLLYLERAVQDTLYIPSPVSMPDDLPSGVPDDPTSEPDDDPANVPDDPTSESDDDPANAPDDGSSNAPGRQL